MAVYEKVLLGGLFSTGNISSYSRCTCSARRLDERVRFRARLADYITPSMDGKAFRPVWSGWPPLGRIIHEYIWDGSSDIYGTGWKP